MARRRRDHPVKVKRLRGRPHVQSAIRVRLDSLDCCSGPNVTSHFLDFFQQATENSPVPSLDVTQAFLPASLLSRRIQPKDGCPDERRRCFLTANPQFAVEQRRPHFFVVSAPENLNQPVGNKNALELLAVTNS